MQVRVAMSAYACRGARHLLQDPNEKPWKADPKYFEKARLALLKKLELGQDVTCRMLIERGETETLPRPIIVIKCCLLAPTAPVDAHRDGVRDGDRAYRASCACRGARVCVSHERLCVSDMSASPVRVACARMCACARAT